MIRIFKLNNLFIWDPIISIMRELPVLHLSMMTIKLLHMLILVVIEKIVLGEFIEMQHNPLHGST